MYSQEEPSVARWELYRLLSEPVRLRLLALLSEEELSIGELSALLLESQPTVSKQVKALRQAGLVSVRKDGTRVFARVDDATAADPVVADGLRAGRALCGADGSLARVPEVLRDRDVEGRRFFEEPAEGDAHLLPEELPAYITALSCLLPRRRLAVDVGTGDGRLLEALAPAFERVYAVDRSAPRLERARRRMALRGYQHVELKLADYADEAVRLAVAEAGGADAVFASRVLHHAPQPRRALAALAGLAAPGGSVVVLDYLPHDDEALRERQADLWLGFDPDSLAREAEAVGLAPQGYERVPAARCGGGPDGHLDWLTFVARRT